MDPWCDMDLSQIGDTQNGKFKVGWNWGVLDFQTNPSGNPSRHWLGFIVLTMHEEKNKFGMMNPKMTSHKVGPPSHKLVYKLC